MNSTLEKFRNNLQAYTDVCNGGRGKHEPLTVFHDLREYNEAANILHAHARLCGTHTFGKGNSLRGNQSMRMTRNTYRLEIQYHREQPRPQNVRDTSKEAYHSIDTASMQGRVAQCIAEASVNGGDITRAEIAYKLDMEKSTVAARVNELVEACKKHPVKIGGWFYRITELDDRRHSLIPDATPVKVIALRAIMCAPENYQPAAPAAQTQLF
jgi:hypothetical protein